MWVCIVCVCMCRGVCGRERMRESMGGSGGVWVWGKKFIPPHKARSARVFSPSNSLFILRYTSLEVTPVSALSKTTYAR